MVQSANALPAEISPAIVSKHFEAQATSAWNTLLWSVESVRAARDAQIRGDFRRSADLAEYAKTDPGIFKALLNRIAPHRGLPIEVEGTGPEAAIAEARSLLTIAVPTDVNADAFEHVAQLGVAIEQVDWTPRADGSRIDPVVTPWPMRTVWWDAYTESLKTLTKGGTIETITHGDGKWIVTKLHSAEPWQWGAIKALSDSWAQRTYARRDRQLNSETHGEGKIIGTLPQDIELDSDMGRLYSEWVAGLRNRRSGGVKAHGYEVEMLEAVSQMWQIFKENITAIDKDIAGAYLGQDGSMVNEGGNYIKTALLFGVRNDIVEGDLGARSSALNTGLLRPWSLLNFGSDFALRMSWCFPDADQDARLDSYAKRDAAFNATIKAQRENNFEITQAWVDAVAARYQVDAPTLPLGSQGKGQIYSWEMQMGLFTINEARRRKGEQPFAIDETVPERDARLKREEAENTARLAAEAAAAAAEEAEKARQAEAAKREAEQSEDEPTGEQVVDDGEQPAEDEQAP